MAIITTTNGDRWYTFDECDCGLTCGCEKCIPTNFHESPKEDIKEYIFPETHEERFLSPDLERFYKKKGYI